MYCFCCIIIVFSVIKGRHIYICPCIVGACQGQMHHLLGGLVAFVSLISFKSFWWNSCWIYTALYSVKSFFILLWTCKAEEKGHWTESAITGLVNSVCLLVPWMCPVFTWKQSSWETAVKMKEMIGVLHSTSVLCSFRLCQAVSREMVKGTPSCSSSLSALVG